MGGVSLPPEPPELFFPRLGNVSFRRGTLTDNQKKLWEENWPRFGRDLNVAGVASETSSSEFVDPDTWFARTGHPTIVEIGSGTGTSTAAMAPLEADYNIIAVEIYRPGLAKLLGAIVRGEIENIRLIRGDGVEVLRHMIAPDSLAGLRLFFPDPWPKKRHHKRRIVQSGTLNLIASRLQPGGVLHIATDHADYAEWIEELAEVEPTLRYRGHQWDDCPILTDRQVITKFEGKGLDHDHVITEFFWEKLG